jgi:thioester reductase-like protein
MIKGCIQLGSAPKRDTMVNLISADYASRAIVHLSRQKASLGKVFHVVNPHPIQWNELVNLIRSFGYPLRQISDEQWRTELGNLAERSPDNALYPLLPTFSESKPHQTSSSESVIRHIDCQNTVAGLGGTSIVCPPVNRELLSTYFSYLIRSGFLKAPEPIKIQTS